MTQLEHPNIVKLHKYWIDKDSEKPRVVFITEYMSSGSLKQFLKKTKRNVIKLPLQVLIDLLLYIYLFVCVQRNLHIISIAVKFIYTLIRVRIFECDNIKPFSHLLSFLGMETLVFTNIICFKVINFLFC